MANPTTNFGWVMPTSSSLVTNLPADFNTFGQAVDTSMSELLGGTTGQVLSKTSNTNMDFTWVTPTDQTPLTTKGDLFTFTTVDARLAVGNNGETLVADSSTSTGLRYQSNFAAGKNKIINGDFGIWQRGTSVAVPANNVQTFQADRFWAQHNGTTNGTITYARQSFTVGQTDVPNNPLYFARITNTTLGTSQTQTEFGQSIEDVTTFAGQTATFSFYVKASAAFTLTGFAWQNFGSGGSGSVFTTLTLSTSTTTTSWQKITATVTVPSVSGKTVGAGNYIAFYIRQGTPTAASTIDFSSWQVEAGSVATAFQTATGTIQGELSACQRYYTKTYNLATAPATVTNNGKLVVGASSIYLDYQLSPQFPVAMRTTPTITLYSNATGASGKIYDANGASDVSANSTAEGERAFSVSATVISGRAYGLHYVASAEL